MPDSVKREERIEVASAGSRNILLNTSDRVASQGYPSRSGKLQIEGNTLIYFIFFVSL